MAETTAPEEQASDDTNATDAAEHMVVESAEPGAQDAPSKQKRPREEEEEPRDVNVASKKQKRAREEDEDEDDEPQDGNVASKKQKVEEEKEQEEKENKEQETVEEVESEQEREEEEEEEKKPSGPVKLGYKTFESSVEMFGYFFKFLHTWPLNLNVNKYELVMLLELLKKGDIDHDAEFGGGIRAFQVRKHPMWQTRWFFFIREDESVEDFSFRKCVDHILPLPEEMQPNAGAAHQLRGKRQGGRGRGGRDRRRDRDRDRRGR